MAPSRKQKNKRACRVCLSAKSENRVTFSIDSEWSRLLDYCFGVIVYEANGPQILCGKCSVKLKEFSELKTLALKNDLLWNNIVSETVKTYEIPSIEIKKIKNEDESDPYHTVEYLEVQNQVQGEKIEPFDTKQDIELFTTEAADYDSFNEDAELKPETSKVKIELKPRKVKYKKIEDISQNEFIKKFFRISKDSKAAKGTWRRTYECRKCSAQYKRKDHLLLHVQKRHRIDVHIVKEKPIEKIVPNLFYCGLCEFTSSNDHEVLEHVKDHCVKNELTCRLCEYVGRDAADIAAHRYKHMPEGYSYKIQCPICEKQPKNLLTLMFHYRSDHLNKIGGWCSVCNKTFSGYKYYRNHERLHTTEKYYICDTCGCKFLFKNLIIRHMEEHMDIRNYVCDTCGKSFKRNNALTYHIRAFHVKNDPVTCHHCGKKFKNQYSLKMHMKMVNKGNNFICDVCSKGYPTLNLLRKHMFWHTGEKPFGCDSCGARYKSKQILEMHKKKHAGYLPYKCDMCEKKFLSTYQLKVHMSVHTGIRRVKCLVCDKTFNEKKRMLEHCKSKHDSALIKNESQCVSLAIV